MVTLEYSSLISLCYTWAHSYTHTWAFFCVPCLQHTLAGIMNRTDCNKRQQTLGTPFPWFQEKKFTDTRNGSQVLNHVPNCDITLPVELSARVTGGPESEEQQAQGRESPKAGRPPMAGNHPRQDAHPWQGITQGRTPPQGRESPKAGRPPMAGNHTRQDAPPGKGITQGRTPTQGWAQREHGNSTHRAGWGIEPWPPEAIVLPLYYKIVILC